MPHVLFKRVSIFLAFSHAFIPFMICSSRTGHPTEVFRSNSCLFQPHLRTGKFRLSGEQSACTLVDISVRWWLDVLSCTPGRALAYFHTHTSLCSYIFTIQVRLSEERAKDDVDVGPDADT